MQSRQPRCWLDSSRPTREDLPVSGKKPKLQEMRPAKPPSLDAFYAAISKRLRGQGIPCAITGGLACVEFGVAEHTEDCDLICPAIHADKLLKVLQSSPYGKAPGQYRKSSPPLEARWLAGGYAAHFHWLTDTADKPFLDVFGVPPRVSSPWEKETIGRFAGMHTVAEMKRTNRRSDRWFPFSPGRTDAGGAPNTSRKGLSATSGASENAHITTGEPAGLQGRTALPVLAGSFGEGIVQHLEQLVGVDGRTNQVAIVGVFGDPKFDTRQSARDGAGNALATQYL